MKKRWIILWLSAMTLNVTAQNEPYKNPELSPSERAWDLLKRMTLEEKVSQMKNGSPAIERLGIPAYDWWNEALHGVARAGKATVFPQAIGLAATFDNQAVMKLLISSLMKPVPSITTFSAKARGMVTKG